MHSNKNE
jgi:hypothetical protein